MIGPYVRSPRERRQKSSVALVMTLLFMALLTILFVAFFQGASHQIRGAQSDAAQARELMLADTAVALVIGQIQQASTQTNQAWISQPGLLRTYSTNAVRAPTACYKLYSTASLANLIDTSGNLNFLATDVPTNWAATPSLYTDLNSPAQTPGPFSRSIYPILDPTALTNTANQTAGTQISGVSSDSGAVTMPVAWLYQLQDGTLGPASNGTAANPIVARIAFWTDDDSCKVNINTAGAPSPWNTPRVNSTNDEAWSSNQPAAGEYSAYPGHPAATSLAVVFGANAYTPQQLLAFTPRYAWGGSQFGTQPTTPGEIVPPKFERLYTSLDELAFTSSVDNTGQRLTNSITPQQIDTARFVLTAHSQSPETTLLGEPRIAIWPIADSTSATAPRLTATDAAITNASTVGIGTTNARSYFFQRHDPLNSKDDFDPANTASAPTTNNLQLFNDLVATRGNAVLPGYGAAFTTKYTGAQWTQLMLEIVDFIHALNAVDPTPAPFVPFAGGDANFVGRAFVEPLTTTYGTGATAIGLRAFGRCPTLSSLTLVFYVSGFNFANGNHVDYEETPDTGGTNWNANFQPASTNWPNVTQARVRAFAVPCTYQPACGYPEVSEPCTVQITGLNGLNMTASTSNDFGFATNITSPQLSDAQQISPADRAWGGNEGPTAWRASAVNAQTNTANFVYPFAGTNAFIVSLTSAQRPTYSTTTHVLTWPSNRPSIGIAKAVPITAQILDAKGNVLQTLNLSFPITGGIPVPLPIAEFTQDGAGNTVAPSYYMTLKNRVLLTGTNREFMIQPNDATRSVESITDFRVLAGLTNVPSGLFKVHPSYLLNAIHAHNLHFADGTALFGATNANILVNTVTNAVATSSVTWTDWAKSTSTNYAWPIGARPGCPTTNTTGGVTMLPTQNVNGDWDTGPGLSPDGALINLPDAGTTNDPNSAYFSLASGSLGAPTQRTPNALVPSPVIFGSLPAGINPATPASSTPWRTLLFCPYPASSISATPYSSHLGATAPPDHLILDNFWMPVVEPWPISTCMATAGKINLNDQIAPFTYLHRNTALRALLDGLRIPAVPAPTANYKVSASTPIANIWNDVDIDPTIAQIENKFTGASVDAYLSESEICTVPLVPKLSPTTFSTDVAATRTALLGYWNNNGGAGRLTGDNLRELPYAQLYSRLTTRSNSYTVHLRVQSLLKLPHDPHQNIWNEGVDLVQGEWRGSAEIERYLDPTAPAPASGTMLGPYKYRILSLHRFAP
jgi:uncharacterized protein (TIGR02600 family)